MSTVIVKENETLDSAIRRWKKKCANDGIIGDLRRKEAYEKPSVRRKKKKRKPRANALTNNRANLNYDVPSRDVVFYARRPSKNGTAQNSISFACFCRKGTARIYAVV